MDDGFAELDTEAEGTQTHDAGAFSRLSREARSVWAKSEGHRAWLPLAQHMRDSQLVAERLLDSYVAPAVLRRWCEFGFDESEVRSVVTFLVGVHDIGKAAPVFVAQHEGLAQRARDAGLPCPPMAELREDRKDMPHARVTAYALTAWLLDRGLPWEQAFALASVPGAHHGRPASREIGLFRRRPIPLGGAPWGRVREELMEWLSALTKFDDILARGRDLRVPLTMLIEVGGLTVVADWLASNTRYFPLRPADELDPLRQEDCARSALAWDELAFPTAWTTSVPTADPDTVYRERFGWPRDRTPTAVQRAVAKIATESDVGLLCIETETGAGKTEAALVAAHTLAGRLGLQGMLIALPTQATTNAMFDRVAAWIEQLPSPPSDVPAMAVMLAHGKSRLHPRFAAMEREIRLFESQDFTEQHEETDSETRHTPDREQEPLVNAVAHQWFMSAKRRLLANFAIVTIDQVLMAALQRKHLALAHFALSGKVIVIDEAHASDEFMNVYLDSVLSWLGAYRAPVIVLSATLTARRRRAMLRAYAPHRAEEVQELPFDKHHYPLITVVPQGDGSIELYKVKERRAPRTVHVSWVSEAALVNAVTQSIANGGCALVVRNTVADAQATMHALVDAGIADVTLSHAGFIQADRISKDATLTSRFGPPGETDRPLRAVVVATQVVEQSLDVDFDVLFTDLAPMDLLFQRIGRLHRHRRPRPTGLTAAQAVLIGDPGDEDAVCSPSAGSMHVYGPHLLLRTAATLRAHGPTLRIPDDVSPLVADALGPASVGPPAWGPALDEARLEYEERLRRQRERATQWSLPAYAARTEEPENLADWLPLAHEYQESELDAAVRDIEPTVEVIVVPITSDGVSAMRPPWHQELSEVPDILDTSSLPTDELAREIASWTVRLPRRITVGRIPDVVMSIDADAATRRWLWRRHPLLKGELLLPMRQSLTERNELHTTLRVADRVHHLRYTPTTGLEVIDDELQSH
ncbi:CRISPR-associated helicase Cas3' [uncultured Tessaracoccus sp.]|uniref:CRISPR-associated helicase Cas3' n=1 Tax=uncultured Tessaracoccus sp. TaxID=905023 RepID=UPI0025D720BD|nr:CRISPR-associated helicase Cas3' [uncultured Tessaracoccus sp.]